MSILSFSLAVTACAGEVEEGTAAGGGPSVSPPGLPVDISIEPPVLEAIESFSSVLRLTWEAPPACEEIEGERRTATSMFEALFTVPGSDTVYVDGDAIEDKTYTYRLRCKLGLVNSDYSNEMTANPADG